MVYGLAPREIYATARSTTRGSTEKGALCLSVIWRSGCRCWRSEEHTSELQSRENLVCRLLLEKKNVIKAVRGVRTELRLQDATDMVEGAPPEVVENASTQAAEAQKTKLAEARAKDDTK